MKHQILPILALLLMLLALGWYIDSLAHKEITNTVKVVIQALAIVVVIALVGLLIFGIFIFREHLLKERANRKITEREAKVMYLIAEEGQQV